MIHGLVIIFLVLAAAFAATHQVAVLANLYWYFWWFDMVMHFWGGLLLGLGLHAMSTLSRFHYQPSLKLLLILLVLATGLWEVFEGLAGLHDPDFWTFVVDTTQDVVLGFAGGLFAHALLRRYTMRSHE